MDIRGHIIAVLSGESDLPAALLFGLQANERWPGRSPGGPGHQRVYSCVGPQVSTCTRIVRLPDAPTAPTPTTCRSISRPRSSQTVTVTMYSAG